MTERVATAYSESVPFGSITIWTLFLKDFCWDILGLDIFCDQIWNTNIIAKWFTLGLSRLHFSQDIWKEEILKKMLINASEFDSKYKINI